jgi:lipid II:glycine glycyltransferase (peptidoglycan interpeptide bridge formation enzyme)
MKALKNNIEISYYSNFSKNEKKFIESEIKEIAKKSIPSANIAHNVELIHILNKAYSYQSEILLVYLDKEIIGFILLSILNNKAISLPHFSYGGYCGVLKLTDSLKDKITKSLSIKFSGGFLIRDFEPYSKNIFTEKVTYSLSLEKSSADQFILLNKKLRSQVRKAIKNDITVEIGCLEDFYKIYTKNMHRKHGSPHLSYDFFNNLVNSYSSGETQIFVTKYNKKVVGSSIVVGYQDFIEVCWAATLIEYNYLSPNMLQYWTMISHAIDNNYKIFSFGRTTIGSGSQKFKKQWGTTEIPLIWSSDKAIDLSYDRLKFLTKVWKLSPTFLANFLSPLITKYIY